MVQVDADIFERRECVGFVGRFKGILAIRTLERELGVLPVLLFDHKDLGKRVGSSTNTSFWP